MKRILVILPLIFILTAGSMAQTADSDSFATAATDSLEESKKHFSFGKQYERSRMYDEAIRQYGKCLAYNSSNASAYYCMGNLYYKTLNQPQKAKEAYKSTIEVDPSHSYAHYMLGRIYYEESKYDSAMVALEKAIAYDSDIEERACLALGDLCVFRGDDSAVKYYLGAIDLIYNDTGRFFTLAKLLDRDGYQEEAISAYRHVLDLDPDHEEALLRLAEIQSNILAYKGALDSYSKLIQMDPENRNYFLTVAKIYERMGDSDGMLKSLNSLIEINPNDISAIAKVAEIYLDRKELKKAKWYIDRGLKIDSKNAKFRVLNGEYYRAKGNDELAIKELEKALSDPEWKNYAQGLIWEIKPPLTEEEKRKREFFERGREKKKE